MKAKLKFNRKLVVVTAGAIGATDNTYKDQGSEVDVSQYNYIGIYCNYTANDTSGATIKVLCKHESAGTEEYVMENSSDYIKTIGNSNIKIFYPFDTRAVSYIQIQTMATDVDNTSAGNGDAGTISIDIIGQL